MARQATPTRDAAHVLVSFQNDSLFVPTSTRRTTSSRSQRPLSLVNANRPPHNRRRVWRACESCRKKKIKCDGSDPCQCCLHSGGECVYAMDELRRGVVNTQMDESFGKRLQLLEDMVATLVDEQRKLAAQIVGNKEGSGPVQDTARPDCSLELDNTAVTQEDPIDVPPVLLDDASDSLIDPDLVQSTGQQAGNGLGVPDTTVAADSAVRPANDENEESTSSHTDDYGQVYMHGDDAQYVGLGATITAMNECAALRAHIRRRLLEKGLPLPESILNNNPPSHTVQLSKTDTLPPVALMDALIDAFFLSIYKLFPIIEAEDFQRQYLVLLSRNETRPGFLSLLHAILAVSAGQISKSHSVWDRDDCIGYRDLDLGNHFYSLSLSALGKDGNGASNNPVLNVVSSHGTSINTVTALTLLGMYLTQVGSLNEAWTMVGQAVRLGLGIGLHRSPKRLSLPQLDIRRRCQLWWCLYVMDRLLSLHLGRPLAINDHDSDIQFPSARPSAPGFVAMTHLCRIIGRLLSAVNSIENAQKWRVSPDEPEIQAKVGELSLELNNWRETMLPGIGISDSMTAEQCVLLSTYSSAVLLLFRPFMPTPHWKPPLFNRALMECFQASVDCILLTGEFTQKVPLCHYFAFNGLNLFMSVMMLLHCIRQANDESMLPQAEEQSQRGLSLLSQLEKKWPLATQHKAIAEEYRQFTQEMVQHGNRVRCSFEESLHIGTVPDTFDPWREFAAQIDFESNIFPSMPDVAWMNELFQLSPSNSQQEEPDVALPDNEQEPNGSCIEKETLTAQPRPKRRKLEGKNPICSFSFKRRA